MLSEADRDALEDIRDNIARVLRFVDGCDLNALVADDRTFYASTRLGLTAAHSRARAPRSHN